MSAQDVLHNRYHHTHNHTLWIYRVNTSMKENKLHTEFFFSQTVFSQVVTKGGCCRQIIICHTKFKKHWWFWRMASWNWNLAMS